MRRVIPISLCVAVGLAMVVAVSLRQNQVATLRAERTQVLARLTEPVEVSLTVAPAAPPDSKQNSHSTSIELLQLRAEVTRLGNRKHELANAHLENNRLQFELTTRGTNVPGAAALPAGYIRKSQARKLGYNTPEATIETMLWAIQNRDLRVITQSFTPETAQGFQREIEKSGDSMEEFFKSSESLVGMRVVSREQASDNSIELQVEIVPGVPPETMRFRKINDEWKMETH